MKTLLIVLIVLAVALAFLTYRLDGTVPVSTHVTTVVHDGASSHVVSSKEEVEDFRLRPFAGAGLAVNVIAIVCVSLSLRKRTPPRIQRSHGKSA
jgi:hypothetical protein